MSIDFSKLKTKLEKLKPSLAQIQTPPTDDVIVSHRLIEDCDWTKLSAEAFEIDTSILKNVNLSDSIVPRVRIETAYLNACNLSNVRCERPVLRKVVVANSKLTGLWATSGLFEDAMFESCRGEFALFCYSTLKRCVFRNCDLQEADFQEADLRGVVFENCNLKELQLSGAKLEGADIRGSKIEGLRVDPSALRGVIVDYTQAAYLATILGIIIR